jgi:hypothetical protein
MGYHFQQKRSEIVAHSTCLQVAPIAKLGDSLFLHLLSKRPRGWETFDIDEISSVVRELLERFTFLVLAHQGENEVRNPAILRKLSYLIESSKYSSELMVGTNSISCSIGFAWEDVAQKGIEVDVLWRRERWRNLFWVKLTRPKRT